MDDDRLYQCLDKLLPRKDALEAHLKNRMGELFDLEYDRLKEDWRSIGDNLEEKFVTLPETDSDERQISAPEVSEIPTNASFCVVVVSDRRIKEEARSDSRRRLRPGLETFEQNQKNYVFLNRAVEVGLSDFRNHLFCWPHPCRRSLNLISRNLLQPDPPAAEFLREQVCVALEELSFVKKKVPSSIQGSLKSQADMLST